MLLDTPVKKESDVISQASSQIKRPKSAISTRTAMSSLKQKLIDTINKMGEEEIEKIKDKIIDEEGEDEDNSK